MNKKLHTLDDLDKPRRLLNSGSSSTIKASKKKKKKKLLLIKKRKIINLVAVAYHILILFRRCGAGDSRLGPNYETTLENFEFSPSPLRYRHHHVFPSLQQVNTKSMSC